MAIYRTLENKLLKQIEEENGFSFRKLRKIIELNGLYKNMENVQ